MSSAQLDWKNLGFQFLPTKGFVQADFAKGGWSKLEVKSEPYIPMHIAANCLHYGQAAFEGLKAFRTKDNQVKLFRPDMNAKRMQASADRICMQAPSETLFVEACQEAVRLNLDFVPPYGTGASLYIRPLLIGTEPTIGIKASETYSFFVLVTPVGPYYKTGFKPVEAMVIEKYDRAAPLGTGLAKIAGNYAASLKASYLSKEKGYPINLFTDPKEHKYVDEFGTSNFIGITSKAEYKTPKSSSILSSITNDSLQVLAKELGCSIHCEPIAMDSLSQFSEVGACGTAAVITPVSAIHYQGKKISFGKADVAGETLTKLYKQLQGIQFGELADKYGWMLEA